MSSSSTRLAPGQHQGGTRVVLGHSPRVRSVCALTFFHPVLWRGQSELESIESAHLREARDRKTELMQSRKTFLEEVETTQVKQLSEMRYTLGATL